MNKQDAITSDGLRVARSYLAASKPDMNYCRSEEGEVLSQELRKLEVSSCFPNTHIEKYSSLVHQQTQMLDNE